MKQVDRVVDVTTKGQMLPIFEQLPSQITKVI